MTIGSICKRDVVVAPKGESIVDTAKRMRMLHVGTVIIVAERDGLFIAVPENLPVLAYYANSVAHFGGEVAQAVPLEEAVPAPAAT